MSGPLTITLGSEHLFVGDQHLSRRTDTGADMKYLHLFAVLILQSGRYPLRGDDVNLNRCVCVERLIVHVHTRDVNLVLAD